MILDSGVLTIYAVSSTEGTAPPPVKWSLSKKRTAVFGDRVVGATRYYAAAKAGQRIDRTVRIWRDHTIPLSVRDICLVDALYYVIVSPVSTIEEAVARAMSSQPRNSGGIQSTRPLVVNLILDGQRFARATVPYINAETTRAGVNIVKK